MKPSQSLNQVAKVLVSLTLVFAYPLLLPGQSDKKSTPPPPPQKSAPAPAPPHTQQHSQQQGQPPARVNTPTGAQGGRSTTTTTQPGSNRGTAAQPNGKLGNPTHVAGVTAGKNNVPGGNTGTHSGVMNPPPGGKVVTTSKGHQVVQDSHGKVTGVLTKSGTEAHFTPTGKLSAIKTVSGTTITHSSSGARLVESPRTSPSGQPYKIVSNGAGRGYVERSFSKGGREYMRRTYVYEGRTNVYVYRNYYYGGVRYYGYVPGYYYGSGFYGWAYTPWVAPVPYAWGWGAAPWYGYYGYYWTPDPVYSSAAFWMTDYIISENLRAAYEARAAGGSNVESNPGTESQGSQNDSGVLTPQVKQMIAEEVKQQLAAEQAAADQGKGGAPGATAPKDSGEKIEAVPPALDPNIKVFIVTTGLTVDTKEGQTCPLSPGDVLMRTGTTPDQEQKVTVSLASRQKADCGMDTTPRVLVANLQEMHNHFREQMDSGLRTLAAKQGTKDNPFPNQPVAGIRENPEGQAVADTSAAKDLENQKQEVQQAETEVQQASAESPAGNRN